MESKAHRTQLDEVKAKDGLVTEFNEDLDGRVRRAVNAGGINWGPADKMNTAIFYCTMEAAECYVHRFYIATIALISAAVEIALNLDKRLSNHKEKAKYKWLTLNGENLRTAQDQGLPVNELLEDDEKTEFKKKDYVPRFVLRRNAIAHGDFERYVKKARLSNEIDFGDVEYRTYGKFLIESEVEAFTQLRKGEDFLIAWVNEG